MIATRRLASLPPAGGGRLARPQGLAEGFDAAPELLRAWRLRRRYRADLRRLLRLGAYLIDDIGLRPGEAAEEAAKPFWRA